MKLKPITARTIAAVSRLALTVMQELSSTNLREIDIKARLGIVLGAHTEEIVKLAQAQIELEAGEPELGLADLALPDLVAKCRELLVTLGPHLIPQIEATLAVLTRSRADLRAVVDALEGAKPAAA